MDAPFPLPDRRLQARLLAVLDEEAKIARALDALGPLAGRRVLLLDAAPRGRAARRLRALGARVRTLPGFDTAGLPGGAFDALVCLWSGFDDAGRATAPLSSAFRALAPGGRVLVVQAYGRDDVSRLLADPNGEQRRAWWSDRRGPLLTDGWRVRTLHCWWTFRDVPTAARLLGAAFPEASPAVTASLRRPRLSFKVAIYHRTVGPELQLTAT